MSHEWWGLLESEVRDEREDVGSVRREGVVSGGEVEEGGKPTLSPVRAISARSRMLRYEWLDTLSSSGYV